MVIRQLFQTVCERHISPKETQHKNKDERIKEKRHQSQKTVNGFNGRNKSESPFVEKETKAENNQCYNACRLHLANIDKSKKPIN